MPKRRQTVMPTNAGKRRPALTPEAAENEIVSLAYDLVRQRLIDGTASSQETTSIIRMGTTKYRLELEKLRKETSLIDSKKAAIDTGQDYAESLKAAVEAFKRYSGNGDDSINEY